MRFLLLSALALACVLPTAPAADSPRARDHMRGARYGEVIVVTGGPLHFTGRVYNTLGLNDCPEARWKALDPAALKKQFRARAVLLNGPRYFLMDRSSLANPGPTETFGGLQARLFAEVKIPLSTLLRGKAKPYTETTVERTSEYLYRKGRPVYELLAPDGRRYVMQTYAQIVDPTLTEADLATLDRRLKLPKGWKYRVRAPDKDLVLRADVKAIVLQDDLANTYQRVADKSG
jgi:hypothetical protein